MLKFTTILLGLIYGYAMYRFSVWRTQADLNQKSKPLSDPVLLAQTAQLARALEIPAIKVHVYDVAPVNGLAASDGRIFITQGFMDRYRAGEVTADEMCSVIAHELGHVALGHARRRMIDFSSQNAMRTAIAMVLNRFLPGIGIWVANGLMTLLAARISRKDEYEADAYASALLIKAGMGTGPQISLFEKLESLTGNKDTTPAWLLSHPKTPQRIAAITANNAQWTG